jgi:predicted nucleic acid-binding protein
VLEAIVQDEDSFVSATVLGEIDVGRPLHRELDAVRRATWLTPVRIEGLAELTVFAEYVRILGSGPRNIGEAETLAWAETHDAVAVIDERAGARAGQQRGVAVHGTLWLIARAIRAAALERHEVVELIDALADAEAWFPSEARGEGFFRWAAEHGLLEE